MKKAVLLLMVCFLCMVIVTPCAAEEFENPPILDEVGYLDSKQLEELSEKLEEIRQKYNFDVAIVTEDSLTSEDAESSADDIYDYNGYGAGENDDGILLYICSSTREYHITAYADGERVFNENGIEYLKKNIQPHLEDDNYYLAMKTYIDLADELLEMDANGEPFNEKQYDVSYVVMVIVGAVLIPLLIAFVMMKSKLAQMKTAVENNYAANYIKPGSKQLTVSRDMFLYSNIIRTEKPKNNSGSHRSSSGRSHGGGGGRF